MLSSKMVLKSPTFFFNPSDQQTSEKLENTTHCILVWGNHLGFVCKERLSSSTIGANPNSPPTKKESFVIGALKQISRFGMDS